MKLKIFNVLILLGIVAGVSSAWMESAVADDRARAEKGSLRFLKESSGGDTSGGGDLIHFFKYHDVYFENLSESLQISENDKVYQVEPYRDDFSSRLRRILDELNRDLEENDGEELEFRDNKGKVVTLGAEDLERLETIYDNLDAIFNIDPELGTLAEFRYLRVGSFIGVNPALWDLVPRILGKDRANTFLDVVVLHEALGLCGKEWTEYYPISSSRIEGTSLEAGVDRVRNRIFVEMDIENPADVLVFGYFSTRVGLLGAFSDSGEKLIGPLFGKIHVEIGDAPWEEPMYMHAVNLVEYLESAGARKSASYGNWFDRGSVREIADVFRKSRSLDSYYMTVAWFAWIVDAMFDFPGERRSVLRGTPKI